MIPSLDFTYPTLIQNKTEKQVFQTLKRKHQNGEKSFKSYNVSKSWIFSQLPNAMKDYYLYLYDDLGDFGVIFLISPM